MSSPSPLSARVPHPHRPHEQLLAAVVGVLCRHCWHWWCRPSHSRRRHPRRAVLVLLLALAVALLARRCPALESLALVAVSTRNPPYEQGLVGLGRVQPRSFLSPSPPHCRCSPSFPVPIPVVPRFHPMSSRGGSGCGGVAVVSWGSTPHIPAVTTKENISYLTKKKRRKYLALRKRRLRSFAPSRGWVWVAQCQPPLLTIVHPLNHKEKHLVSKEKQKTKQKKRTSITNNGYRHSRSLVNACRLHNTSHHC